MQLLMKGNRQRTQEPTAANRTSSRSHAVLQVAVRQRSRVKNILQEVRQGRLFMIDLAGSERASQVRPAYLGRTVCVAWGSGRAVLPASWAPREWREAIQGGWEPGGSPGEGIEGRHRGAGGEGWVGYPVEALRAVCGKGWEDKYSSRDGNWLPQGRGAGKRTNGSKEELGQGETNIPDWGHPGQSQERACQPRQEVSRPPGQ